LSEDDAELFVQAAISEAESVLKPSKVHQPGPAVGLNRDYYQGGLKPSF
jgi:hypothetical protein